MGCTLIIFTTYIFYKNYIRLLKQVFAAAFDIDCKANIIPCLFIVTFLSFTFQNIAFSSYINLVNTLLANSIFVVKLKTVRFG